MRVRLIVECEARDVVPLLEAMPTRTTNWDLRAATYQPVAKPHSIRAEVIASLPEPKARKRHRRPAHNRTPTEVRAIKNQLVQYIAANPGQRWSTLKTWATEHLGISPSHAPGLLALLRKEGRIVRQAGHNRTHSTYEVAKGASK